MRQPAFGLTIVRNGGFMSSCTLVWAAVPHNGDGVVFQVRIAHGLQRFYISRRVLEDVFNLELKASDAKELERFYASLNRILEEASKKRSTSTSGTVALFQPTGLIPASKEKGKWSVPAIAQTAV
jgi:hypothetical protein